MSDQDGRRGAPSNAELGERTARIEESVERVEATTERIEQHLSEQHDELAEDVQANSEKVGTLWTYHQALKVGVPVLGVVGTLLGGLAAAGVV